MVEKESNTFDDFGNSSCWAYLTSNWLLPFGGVFAVLFVGFVMKKEEVKKELSNEDELKIRWFSAFYFVIRYIAPIAIVLILLNQLGVFSS